jgi:hypothetical protein
MLVKEKTRSILIAIFQIADLTQATDGSDSTFVPSKGWFIYDTFAPANTSLWLTSLDAQWREGPHLFENKKNDIECIEQVCLS